MRNSRVYKIGGRSVSAVKEFFKGGIQSVALLNKALADQLPLDLMLQMLARFGPGCFYYIDTVDKASGYDIRLAGVPNITMDWDAFVRLCDNFTSGLRGPESPDSSLFNLEITPDPEKTKVETAMRGKDGITIGSRHGNCAIQTNVNPGDDFEVEESPMEPWQSLPHYVTLQELAKAGPTIDAKAFETRYGDTVSDVVDENRRK